MSYFGNLSDDELQTISKIARRSKTELNDPRDKVEIMMDLALAHKDYPLSLNDFLSSDRQNFSHDILGIRNHLNRRTGQLEDFFVPRFALQKG